NIKASDTKPVSVKTSTKDLIPGLVSVTQMDGLGVLAGGVRDCDNNETQGAIVDVEVAGYDPKGKIFYFQDVEGMTVPVRQLKWTAVNGVFAALNVPPGTGKVSARGKIGSGTLMPLFDK